MFHRYGHLGTLRLPIPVAPDSQLDVWTQHMDGWCMDVQLVLRQAWHGTSFWLKVSLTSHTGNRPITDTRAPSQYPKRRLSVRSRKVSKPRDLYLESSDRSEIWQALRQQCCRCACQISKRYDNLKYQSRGFETTRSYEKTSFRILRRGPGYSNYGEDILNNRKLGTFQMFGWWKDVLSVFIITDTHDDLPWVSGLSISSYSKFLAAGPVHPIEHNVI